MPPEGAEEGDVGPESPDTALPKSHPNAEPDADTDADHEAALAAFGGPSDPLDLADSPATVAGPRVGAGGWGADADSDEAEAEAEVEAEADEQGGADEVPLPALFGLNIDADMDADADDDADVDMHGLDALLDDVPDGLDLSQTIMRDRTGTVRGSPRTVRLSTPHHHPWAPTAAASPERARGRGAAAAAGAPSRSPQGHPSEPAAPRAAARSPSRAPSASPHKPPPSPTRARALRVSTCPTASPAPPADGASPGPPPTPTPLSLWLADLCLSEYEAQFVSVGFKKIDDFDGLSPDEVAAFFTLKVGDHRRLLKHIAQGVSPDLIAEYEDRANLLARDQTYRSSYRAVRHVLLT